MSRQTRLVISVAAEIIFAAKIYKKIHLLYFCIYNLTVKLYFVTTQHPMTDSQQDSLIIHKLDFVPNPNHC